MGMRECGCATPTDLGNPRWPCCAEGCLPSRDTPHHAELGQSAAVVVVVTASFRTALCCSSLDVSRNLLLHRMPARSARPALPTPSSTSTLYQLAVGVALQDRDTHSSTGPLSLLAFNHRHRHPIHSFEGGRRLCPLSRANSRKQGIQ